MRSLSPGHYAPSDDEYRRGWETGIVAVDASVLLSLYRYSTETRDELLKLLGIFADRLWLPHQAAVEYEQNRLAMMAQQVAAYDVTLEAFQKSIRAIRAEFSKLARHPLLDEDALSRMTDQYEERVTELIEETRARHPNVGTSQAELMADPTREALEVLFQGRVGPPYPRDEYEEAVVDARARIDDALPPGYLDREKPEPERYGDYLFWRQATERARSSNVPLIILTDDDKEDWWWRFGGMTLGPRPELVQEFFDSSGERLLIYTTRRFIEEAARSGLSELTVSAEAVGEVERLAAERTVRYETRVAECPRCGAENEFRIGSARDHRALPTCTTCGQRFHAFHTADGGIGTRLPGTPTVRARARVSCAECGVAFETTLPAAGRTKDRTCLQCGALLEIDAEGGAVSHGLAERFDVGNDEDDCPRCGAEVRFVYRTLNDERTSCTRCQAFVVRPLLVEG